MALIRKFNGKQYRYRGSSRRKVGIKADASKVRERGKLARVVKTGKGPNTLYTLYVR